MQLHTIMIANDGIQADFCVFTGSGSPTDAFENDIDSSGCKVVRVEFSLPLQSWLDPFELTKAFNEAIKAAEQKATEEYHKQCALYGPMSVDLTGHAFDPEVFVTSQGAFTNKEGVTVPLNNAEVKVALGQYVPTAAENEAAEDFFKRHGVQRYTQNSAGKRLDAEAMQELMAHDQEIDKAISKIAAAYPRAFGIVKQPLTPEQKADMDKYYEILMRQTKDAVGAILIVDNLSQLGLPKRPENATAASFRRDLGLSADDHFLATGRLLADAKTNPQHGLLNTFLSEAEKAGITHLSIGPHQTAMYAKPENTVNAVGPVRLNTSDPAYYILSTDTGRIAVSAVSYLPIDQQKLPTSDPVALDAMIEKRTKMAEALRKQGVEFVGYEADGDGNKVAKFKPIDNANIEALKQRVGLAKRSWIAALAKPNKDGNYVIECERCYNEFLKACTALRQSGYSDNAL